MLNKNTHARVWATIDELAARRKITVSALARLANLDATSFNPSKRIAPGGHLHFPNMETLLKVFVAYDITWDEWTKIWNKWDKK